MTSVHTLRMCNRFTLYRRASYCATGMQGHSCSCILCCCTYEAAEMELVECYSILTDAMGVKFYEGLAELHPLKHVRLCREPDNSFDSNSILVKTKSGKVLGHVAKKVAGLLAPIMDSMLPGLIIKW